MEDSKVEKKIFEHMNAASLLEFDAKKAKIRSNGQILPRNGRIRIAEEAQAFLDVRAALGRIGPRGA